MDKKSITYEEFIEGYNQKKFTVLVNKNKAGDFVLCDFANKHYKPAHLFWSWTGIILTLFLPILLLFIASWIYVVGSFISGIIIINSARKSAVSFVLRNMLENESFWEYILMHKGARIIDENGDEIFSASFNFKN